MRTFSVNHSGSLSGKRFSHIAIVGWGLEHSYGLILVFVIRWQYLILRGGRLESHRLS